MKQLTIFTIGHSNQPFSRFLKSLENNGVKQLIDVRTIPKSRAVPWANYSRLSKNLTKYKIIYKHLKELGGLRHPKKDSKNIVWRNASFRGYADYMETSEFEKSLKKLIKLSKKKPTAIMCGEAVPWRCHRSMIADALTAKKIKVVHIMSPTNSHKHKLISFAHVRNGKVIYR